ncbi:hypothetical protein DU508_18220 [Pedobacter chinensis]|uniref:LTD domain-containing protein n=1 Tax=Pedobacter chinensis TaxID=2282421 RepID=A0A369PWL9_9SPHI|nr:lamin tail domain-containing protein [Pedobacter chinensis]RDC55089.1 hypothetical protein DU508_18220 [Pedobacter chinensis]
MKKILLISLLLFSKIAFSQFSDHFEDGNFTQNPVWQGDENYFFINAGKQLQSNGPQLGSQILALSTVNQNSLNTSWEFFVKLNFDPTATNFVRIYLTSNQQDLKSALNGYFVQIGETGSTDGFHLYRQTGTSTSRIITGSQKTRVNNNVLTARIKITRDDSGLWNLYTDVNGGQNFIPEGSVTDKTFTTSGYAGVYCRYATASRYSQYIFDDFEVKDLVPDVTPPTIKNVTVVDQNNLEVTFSKPIDQNSGLTPINYTLSGGYSSPENVSLIDQNNYRLTFKKSFLSGNYSLIINDVKDKTGNTISANSAFNFFYVKPYLAEFGDVVINEIFANPTGSKGLPQKEFIELWNTTNEYILTAGWKYSDQTSTYTFQNDTIKPAEYIILCAKADTNLFKPFGKTIGLSPWPSLNNDKDILTLSNAKGTTIDKVAYYDSWYRDDLKKKGGYSLELIDPKNSCKGSQNWSSSTNVDGGTPGKENSIFHAQLSTEIPKLIQATVVDSVTILVQFSKPVDSLSAVQAQNYTVNNGVGYPLKAVISPPQFSLVTLKFKTPLIRGVLNTLNVKDLIDCAGNQLSPSANSVQIFMAKKISKNDILISEVLFNPKPKGVDFVEIFNNTNQPLDLKDLQLANIDTKGTIANIKSLSTKSLLIDPGTYWVISSDTLNVKQNYFVQNPDNFVQITSLPAYNNDKGSVILLSNNIVIDRLNYNAKIHHPLIHDEDGISIERVSFRVDTNEPNNFKSAAATVGFATPTYKNSQESSGDENFVRLKNKTFSPDNDGFDDVMALEYQVAENTSLATVNIYSDKGRLVKKLLKNQTIGTNGTLTWDGLDDNGQKAAIGIYVVLFDVFDLKGNTKRFRNTVVLARKLN